VGGKVPRSLGQCRHGRNTRPADQLSGALIITKEEGLLFYNRAAQDESELIAPEDRLVRIRCGLRLKQVASVENLVSQELKDRSVQLIGPRLRCEIDDPSVESPELR